MKNNVRGILDIALYAIMFLIIQLFFTYIMAFAMIWIDGDTFNEALAALANGKQAGKMIAVSVLGNAMMICLFTKLKWAPISRSWLKSKPWGVLFWSACLALGTILPSEWIVEQIQYTMPESAAQLLESIMGEPWGYLAVGILAPIAEELVFRGAILRTLLNLTGQRRHWIAIAISAVIFGAAHGNLPQFVHATLIGLLLGWMYYRTKSILPGVLFHWVNNTVAYIMFNIMPQMADGKLIDLFHGSKNMMLLGLFFSFCILIPSLLQLCQRMKPVK